MKDLPDPGHPYDDFPEGGADDAKPPFWQAVLGFLWVPGCFLLFVAFAIASIDGDPAVAGWGGWIALGLLVSGPLFAHFVLRWRGFFRGFLVGLGLGLLAFGYCALGGGPF